mgnify:CR=1 FL=1
MESFTLVDNLFMNEYLPYAEEGYIKVYLYGLYLCTNPSGRDNSVESFAKVLDMDEDKILEIFKYWQDQGLLEIISELLSCGTLENVTLRTLPWLPLYGIRFQRGGATTFQHPSDYAQRVFAVLRRDGQHENSARRNAYDYPVLHQL